MQFGTKFWYRFLVTNKVCSIFVLVYGTSFQRQFLVCVSLALLNPVYHIIDVAGEAIRHLYNARRPFGLRSLGMLTILLIPYSWW